jgi:hypothetical protein
MFFARASCANMGSGTVWTICPIDNPYPIKHSGFMAKDINQVAAGIVAQSTGQKNAAAVVLGRLGGLKGGKARAAALSARKRREIAKRAAASRWSKKR